MIGPNSGVSMRCIASRNAEDILKYNNVFLVGFYS